MLNANDVASFMIKMILNLMKKNFTRAQLVNTANKFFKVFHQIIQTFPNIQIVPKNLLHAFIAAWINKRTQYFNMKICVVAEQKSAKPANNTL